MWFTEDPWPPFVILAFAAFVCGAIGLTQARRKWLVACVVALVACGAVFFIERAIVTEGERVEARIRDLAAAFQRKDRQATLAFFSVDAPEWRRTVEQALDWVDVHGDLDIKDMSVETSDGDSRAISRFRANGTVSYRGLGMGYHPSRWEIRWHREGNDWKIVDVVRLNPMTDDRLAIFDQRPH